MPDNAEQGARVKKNKNIASIPGNGPEMLLAMEELFQCPAAADAYAEGTTIGTGGWVVTSNAVAWFAETWTGEEARKV